MLLHQFKPQCRPRRRRRGNRKPGPQSLLSQLDLRQNPLTKSTNYPSLTWNRKTIPDFNCDGGLAQMTTWI